MAIILIIVFILVLVIINPFKHRQDLDEMKLNEMVLDIFNEGVTYFNDFKLIGKSEYKDQGDVLLNAVEIYQDDNFVFCGYITGLSNNELFVTKHDDDKANYKIFNSQIITIK